MGDFNAQGLANTAWAFATTGQSDGQLFMVLARAAGWFVGDFNAQELSNTAWAFATADEPTPALLNPISVLDAVEGEGIKDQSDVQEGPRASWMGSCLQRWQGRQSSMWATSMYRGFARVLSQRKSLSDVWSLFNHTKNISLSFGPLCFGVLSMECEQRGSFEHEIVFLKGLEGAAGKWHRNGLWSSYEICWRIHGVVAVIAYQNP